MDKVTSNGTERNWYALCKKVLAAALQDGDVAFLESERSSLYKEYISMYEEDMNRREQVGITINGRQVK